MRVWKGAARPSTKVQGAQRSRLLLRSEAGGLRPARAASPHLGALFYHSWGHPPAPTAARSREQVNCGGRGGTSLRSDREEQPEGLAGHSLRALGARLDAPPPGLCTGRASASHDYIPAPQVTQQG